jgi:hypothetical protein
MLSPYVPRVDLESAVLYLGRVPWYLPKRFTAIVRGNRIFVRALTQSQGSADWFAFLGHELTHVGQYRTGMNAWRYLRSAARGYANSRYEREAFAVQSRILADLTRIRAGSEQAPPGGASPV